MPLSRRCTHHPAEPAASPSSDEAEMLERWSEGEVLRDIEAALADRLGNVVDCLRALALGLSAIGAPRA